MCVLCAVYSVQIIHRPLHPCPPCPPCCCCACACATCLSRAPQSVRAVASCSWDMAGPPDFWREQICGWICFVGGGGRFEASETTLSHHGCMCPLPGCCCCPPRGSAGSARAPPPPASGRRGTCRRRAPSSAGRGTGGAAGAGAGGLRCPIVHGGGLVAVSVHPSRARAPHHSDMPWPIAHPTHHPSHTSTHRGRPAPRRPW